MKHLKKAATLNAETNQITNPQKTQTMLREKNATDRAAEKRNAEMEEFFSKACEQMNEKSDERARFLSDRISEEDYKKFLDLDGDYNLMRIDFDRLCTILDHRNYELFRFFTPRSMFK